MTNDKGQIGSGASLRRQTFGAGSIAATPFASRKRVDTEHIFETIRYRISTLEYRPGEILKEMELAAEFGASRTPVRQVLQRLELAGLIEPVVGYGSIVTPIDYEATSEVLKFRLQLALMLEHFLDADKMKRAASEFATLLEEQNSGEPGDATWFAELSHRCRWHVLSCINNRFVANTWIDTYYYASRLWYTSYDRAKMAFQALQREELETYRDSFATGDPKQAALTMYKSHQRWMDAIWESMKPA
ncbi:GntR family transcriptional regulator [Mesorhizobium sp. M1312]|uniref:GntR family transcriptional regulator n=1 Tax=unclassified Mesorhizobium TaxID=325217 RepID=UPI00333628BE